MNADKQDLILSYFSKTKETVGMGFNLSISEKICVLLNFGWSGRVICEHQPALPVP